MPVVSTGGFALLDEEECLWVYPLNIYINGTTHPAVVVEPHDIDPNDVGSNPSRG